MPRRDWKQARAKVDREMECRVCRTGDSLQAAHTIGRIHDPADGKVRARDIVPLCPSCHQLYDARRLDLLPYLNYDEQAAAVEHLGIVRAMHRLTGSRSG
jgi:hypothetical protein